MEDREGMRIGLFGGTFDPPHNGHINLILSLQEAHHLDAVLVIPARTNPLKPPVVPFEHRLVMAHLAFDTVPGCTVLDVEARKNGPSYTIDTIEWLMEHHKAFATAERFLLLGADAAASLPKWRHLDRILTFVRPLIAARSLPPKDPIHPMCELFPEAKARWTETALLDISSTDIRVRIHQGLYVDHLVPGGVMRYIRESELYK